MQWVEIIFSWGWYSAWGSWGTCRGPNLVSKADGEPLGYSAWVRSLWHSGLCRTEFRFQETIVRLFPTKCIVKAKWFFRESDSFFELVEETHGAPGSPHLRNQSALAYLLTRLLLVFYAGVTLASSIVTFVLSQGHNYQPVFHNAWQEDPFLAHCSTQWHTIACCPVVSFVRNWGTSLANTCLIPRLCVIIVLTEILSSSTSSLIVKCQFLLMNSLMWSAILLVWAVDGQPVSGSLLMAVWPFLKWDWLIVVLLNVDYSILHV